ncbi:hypothetical protein EKO04_004378 [Ascochyta lentis]|uniref:Rhodopsin domain-containing protein n=1 Tax=Ascochyta lentis TaxID=205686 RepID=A0A8H7J771_9PLEO|nr:hypothetical protein EKO04_004378 [Ascochyta lentis]
MKMTVPIENGGQIGILIASAVSIFTVVFFVSLRLIAKWIGSRLDYSDYCIIAALACNTALHTCCMLLVTHGGFGFHTTEIYTRFGPDIATFFFKGIMSFALLWNATVCFSKLSVLLMYTTLIPNRSLTIWARVFGLFIIMWNVSDIVGGFLICQPMAKNWDFTLPGTCGSQPNYYFSMGIINIITDIFLIGLPMPYLYRLRLEWRKKILAMALLSIGVVTWVITIYRQTLLPNLNFADMTYDGVLATVLSGLEPAVAIVLPCIPLLRPLYKTRGFETRTSQYHGSSGASELFSKKGSKSNNYPFDAFHDNSSEIQLQPFKHMHNVRVSATPISRGEDTFTTRKSNVITVGTKWEVRSG